MSDMKKVLVDQNGQLQFKMGGFEFDIDDKDVIPILEDIITKLNDPLDEPTIIEIDSSVKYLSEIWTDLPHNAYINKGITGCGGTTLAITNTENYVIAVHSTNIIRNKMAQHFNICGVFSDTTNDDIKNYIKNNNGPKKFMVTYDSLPRLLAFIDTNDYRLLVDEAHILIRYLGHFKTSVCHQLIDMCHDFKSTSFLTATPTGRQYLPSPLKKLNYVELIWNHTAKPEIQHMYCGKQLQTKVVSFINDKLDSTNDEIYIFYNSRSGVMTTINKLLLIRDDITINDINIIFADSDENMKFFRQKLKSKELTIGYDMSFTKDGMPTPDKNKRINFISSFGFEGVDFYTHGKNAITLIVADSDSRSMRYDISIDIPQILGRFRRDPVTKLFPRNDIYFLWKSVPIEVEDNVNDIIYTIGSSIKFGNVMLENAPTDITRKSTRDIKRRLLVNWDPYLIAEYDGIPVEDRIFMNNKYAMEGIMSVYLAVHVDYHVQLNETCNGNISMNSPITCNLKDLCSKVTTFDISPLNNTQLESLDRKVGFGNLCKEYIELTEKIKNPFVGEEFTTIKGRIEEILEMSDFLRDSLEYVPIETMRTYKFNQQKIKEIIRFVELKNVASNYGFNPDILIPYNDVPQLIQKMYDENDIKRKPRRTILDEWFNVEHRVMVNGEIFTKLNSLK